jgi:hypothetical protein
MYSSLSISLARCNIIHLPGWVPETIDEKLALARKKSRGPVW